MFLIGKNLKDHLVSTAPHLVRMPRAPSNLASSSSRDGAPHLLWAAVPVPPVYFFLTSNLSPLSVSLKSLVLPLHELF